MYLITFTLLKIRESDSTGKSKAKSRMWRKEELGMLPKHTEFYLKERNMNLAKFYYVRFFIKSNQINHFYCHITTAQVPWWVKFLRACSRQCKKTAKKKYVIKKKLHIDSTYTYRLYRRQCAKYIYIYSVHIVYYKDILSHKYTLYTFYIMYTSVHSNMWRCNKLYIIQQISCATDSCAKVHWCRGCALNGVQW